MRCMKCGRALKRPSESGYGPRCQIAVLGHKPKRDAKPEVKRDTLTPDLWEEAPTATWGQVVNLMQP